MKSSYNFLSSNDKKRLRNRMKLGSNVDLRMSVFKSNRHFHAQLIDDAGGITLASASTLDPRIKDICNGRVNAESVKQVSSLMVERLSNMNLDRQMVFDRGRYKYAGLVSQFAEALRASGFKL